MRGARKNKNTKDHPVVHMRGVQPQREIMSESGKDRDDRGNTKRRCRIQQTEKGHK